MATFTVFLPPIEDLPENKDIAIKHLTMTPPDGSPAIDREVAADVFEIGGLVGPKGDYPSTLHYHDDETPPNTSVAREQILTVSDTIAPGQPGEFSVRLDSE